MNLRNAVILAFGGWYLMMPVVDPHGAWKPVPLPLSQWDNEGSYDSASQCMDAREHLLNEFKMDGMPKPGLTVMNSLGQCIASDDPRLAK